MILRQPPPAPPPQPRPLPDPPLPSPPGGFLLGAPTITSGSDGVTARLLDERIIVLGGPLDDDAAHRITAQLLLLAAQDPRRDITLHLDSPGGPVAAGLAVHDTMAMIEPDVATWAVGVVASTAQFLLSTGAPGKRYATPHARVRMQSAAPGWVSPAVHDSMKVEIARLTAARCGRTAEVIAADVADNRWFTAPEARAHGLIDHIAGPSGATVAEVRSGS